LGTGTSAEYMDLNSINTSAFNPGNLVISFTQYNNNTAYPGFTMAWGGTVTNGSATYAAYYSNTNNPFATTSLIGTLPGTGSFTGAFSGTTTGLANTIAPYSLTQVVTVTPNPGLFTITTYSGNASLNPVPEPSTLVLLGLGLGVLGLSGHRRIRQNKTSNDIQN
jgi:hypothetical protein